METINESEVSVTPGPESGKRRNKKKAKKETEKPQVETMDNWSDFGLRRLFNPESTEFLPMEDQLKLYKHRDLTSSKMFATAARVFGHPRIRKRIHIAPKMGDGPGRSFNVRQANADLKPMTDGRPRLQPLKTDDMVLTERDKQILHEKEVQEQMTEYKSWLQERMALRAGLESMGLKESWLKAKPNPTPLERRVLAKLVEARLTAEALKLKVDKTEPVPVKTQVTASEDDIQPQPEGISIIAEYLSSRKQRLIDLFQQADKDKSWTITRDEFMSCIKEARIPISETLLNELMDSLDMDANLEINYSEFVRGMEKFHLQERKKKIIEERRKSNIKATMSSPVKATTPKPGTLTPVKESALSPVVTTRTPSPKERGTPDSLASLLEIPKKDITERRPLSPDDMIEKRKRERYQSANLKKNKRVPRQIQSPLKTGNKAVDLHCQTTTLSEDLRGEIHDYRAGRLAEYHAICRLCEECDIPLTPKLLERALLHPGDKKVNHLKKRIRQAGTHTMSSKFADPPEPPESPSEYHDMEKVVVTKSGEVLMESKHVYPKRHDVRPSAEMMNLSSGKAFVSRKIDCWMSFEEYDKLTKHLKKRYISLENVPSHDVFWPGFLLDKVQVYMPETRTREQIKSHSVFQPTTLTAKRSNPGFDNNVSYWLVSDKNYLKSGGVDERKIYNIDWK